jgi:hypothetical protein
MPNDRTGLLIIRAWVEDGSSSPLRAQLSTSSDVAIGIEHKSMQTDPAAVGAEVQAWLSEILAAT